MKLEIHLLQNFAPSNLNRDDTGAPKDCELGGHRRARISSQCQKRAVRQAFVLDKLVPADDLAARTKRLAIAIADVLEKQHKHNHATALAVAMAALEGQGLKRKNKPANDDDAWKTEYLLFVPSRTVTQLASVLHTHWDTLSSLVAPAEEAPAATEAPADDGKKGKKAAAKTEKADKKKAKADAQKAYPKEVGEAVGDLLESAGGAVDLALFGRMIADAPEWNVDASCQVAHALSTNRVHMDFDFFTAVDDLKPKDTAGSDMMGTVQFNSSCFYRYAVLDVTALRKTLDGNKALVSTAVNAFVKAFVTAIPTGKQNNTAAHNLPSYVRVIVREGGPSVSLANAFLKPAKPNLQADKDLVDDSIEKLESYVTRYADVLGKAEQVTFADRDLAADPSLTRVPSLSKLYEQVAGHVAKVSS